MQKKRFTADETTILNNLISKASRNAISGIAEMVKRDVEVETVNPKQIQISKIKTLLRDPSSNVIGIELGITGDANGNMLLMYPPEVALGLADLLMDKPVGRTQSLEEMSESALGEMGNIAGGFFLNSLADDTHMRLLPTPPMVVVDTAQSLLDQAMEPIAKPNSTSIFVLETVFKVQGQKISGNFMVLSSPSLLDTLVKRSMNIAQTS
ncbi:MAG: chemotaxis protein CheX [Chloroflexota bacterium]|nr:chemotaxis protein CheX [Chloroflexota bacterium]